MTIADERNKVDERLNLIDKNLLAALSKQKEFNRSVRDENTVTLPVQDRLLRPQNAEINQ
jgi:hypothetical protein